MISVEKFKEWAASLPDSGGVGVDEGGLQLTHVLGDGSPSGIEYEIGGVEEQPLGPPKARRTARAVATLSAYRGNKFYEDKGAGVDTVISDLLADLMELRGLHNWEKALRVAQSYHEADVEGGVR